MNKKEIEKIEVERDFYNIMSNYGKLGYKINKITEELNEISKLADLVAKEKKETENRIQKAIEYLENQLTQLDFYEDTKARVLCSMAIVILRGNDNEER